MDISKELIFNWLKAGLIVILIVALGILALNQYIGYHYKVQLLKEPCGFCAEINPQLKECLKPSIIKTIYPNISNLNITFVK